MAATGKELDELAGQLVTYPQVLVNVRVRERSDYQGHPRDGRDDSESRGPPRRPGTIAVRYSGTEPLLRIMLEGKDDQEIRGWANEIAEVVRTHLG